METQCGEASLRPNLKHFNVSETEPHIDHELDRLCFLDSKRYEDKQGVNM